jgi:quercetin dioxygenase-like cupin family protein
MKIVNLNDAAEFSPDAHVGKVVCEEGHLKARLVCIEAGQRVPPCRMEHDVAFYVLEGQGTIRADDEQAALLPGTLALVQGGGERSIEAQARMRVLAVQAI